MIASKNPSASTGGKLLNLILSSNEHERNILKKDAEIV